METLSEESTGSNQGHHTTSERARTAPADSALYDNIPDELKALRQWVGLKLVPQKGKKPKKVPINPASGRTAAVDEPASWGTFDEAVAAVTRYKLAGIGFVFTADDPYAGIDLDECRDPATGALQPWALDVVQRFDSYTEASFFGTGVHILPKGTLPSGGGQHEHVEMYDHGRYFVMTGAHVAPFPTTIEARQGAIDALYAEHFPHKLNGKAKTPAGTAKASTAQHNALWRDLFEALPFIPAVEYDTWLKVGMGLHSVESDINAAGFALWVEWSQSCPEKFKLDDCRKRWEGFTADGGITEKSIFALAIEHGWRSAAAEALTGVDDRPPEADGASQRASFHLTDLGNAERLIARYGQDLLFNNLAKKFLTWDMHRWAVDETQQVRTWARETIRGLYGEVQQLTEETKEEGAEEQKGALAKHATALLRHAVRSEAEQRINAMLHNAQMDVPILPKQLDADPWLLNVQNGTLDLLTGKLHPHRREDRITKIIPILYDPDATCPRWEQFLYEVMAGKEDLVDFLKKGVGYSLTGDCREDCVFLLWGVGRNGKTTFIETTRAVVGDYARKAAFATFLHKDRESVRNDIAALHGARFVSATEADAGRRLSEAILKELTGRDTVTARFLFQEHFEFVPQLKLWLGTNHKPVIKGTDDGIWSRLRLVPFTQKFTGTNDDKTLSDKLKAELPGILAWAVRGCVEWQRDGLPIPEAVKNATAEYRGEMDVLGAFLAECCDQQPHLQVKAGTLYHAYVLWSGDKQMTQNAFGRELTDRGIAREKIGPHILRIGIALSTEWDPT